MKSSITRGDTHKGGVVNLVVGAGGERAGKGPRGYALVSRCLRGWRPRCIGNDTKKQQSFSMKLTGSSGHYDCLSESEYGI